MQTDVLIVGAGPAGSTLARLLADRGRAVTLLDKAAFPRRKPCGGGLPARTAAQLGLRLESALRGRVERVCLSGLASRDIRLEVEKPALVVDRAAFDKLLVDEAVARGARFRPETRILDVRPNGAGWRVRTNSTEAPLLDANILCACDGARSRLSHTFGGGVSHYGLAIQGEAPFAKGLDESDKSAAIFDFGCGRGGYGWLFPYGDKYNAGVGFSFWKMPDVAKRLQAMCRRQRKLLGGEATGVMGAALPRFEDPRMWYAKEHFYMLGDAAGLVDPLTGEGIHYAVKSAFFAAEAILAGDEAMYSRLVREELTPELSVAKHFSDRWRWTPVWLIRLLLGGRRIRDYAALFAENLTGGITYAELYKRMHGGKI